MRQPADTLREWVGQVRRRLGALWGAAIEEPAHLRAGRWGERVAEAHLRRQGMQILGRRIRAGRRDEIDLVARDGESLVFVEVKTRRGEDFGRPADAVDRRKRQTLSRGAIRYLRLSRWPNVPFRFDIVEVVGSPEDGEPQAIRHLPNAFPMDARYRVPARPVRPY